jgi:branched-chain amino acid transport system ATP-binding protein
MLDVQGISINFNGVQALNNVKFKVNPAEIVGIIGPNGAGKTTLFNVITGFNPADSGNVFLNGTNITKKKPEEICKLGIGRTFQLVKPFGKLTASENVMIGAFSRTNSITEARKIAEQELDFIGLLNRKDDFAANLTLTDRKKLEIARILATNPKILMLDETMSGLTPGEINQMIVLIKDIQKRGICLLVIEHIMRVIMNISERIIVLHHGELICDDIQENVVKDKNVIKAYLGEGYSNA